MQLSTTKLTLILTPSSSISKGCKFWISVSRFVKDSTMNSLVSATHSLLSIFVCLLLFGFMFFQIMVFWSDARSCNGTKHTWCFELPRFVRLLFLAKPEVQRLSKLNSFSIFVRLFFSMWHQVTLQIFCLNEWFVALKTHQKKKHADLLWIVFNDDWRKV